VPREALHERGVPAEGVQLVQHRAPIC
jgi:hypothetical protein